MNNNLIHGLDRETEALASWPCYRSQSCFIQGCHSKCVMSVIGFSLNVKLKKDKVLFSRTALTVLLHRSPQMLSDSFSVFSLTVIVWRGRMGRLVKEGL